ncbi:MAG: NFACT RNA binding domain-containing protein [Spirochaetaceae bacterium]|jgi:predicted ribosome quality control (RQC) complex YloA/Tae2 family protein|nr:NFACT RNA binding domain-containing protein [Spirochaetaceae bacterium]
MSLNWKEINLILEELDLCGSQIQKVIQSTFDVLALRIHGRNGSKTLIIALNSGACRLHETFRAIPKNNKPLRFAEFLNSRLINGRIEEAVQLGDNRIVRFIVRTGEGQYRLYIRLWSNAANFIVCSSDGTILDAMRRHPKRGEITGGRYAPEESLDSRLNTKPYTIRELAGSGSFNEKIDTFYAEQGGALSLESLREQARRIVEGSTGRLVASLEKLRLKRAEYADADRLKEYGDIILANSFSLESGAQWLEAEDFYRGGTVRIKLSAHKSPAAQAEQYYEQYRKAKSGYADLCAEIQVEETELQRLSALLDAFFVETNPLRLHKMIEQGTKQVAANLPFQTRLKDQKRPGLSFRRGDWLLIVGRSAAENDDLLRHYVKGQDLWLHVRDYPGSYVFIKARSGKSYPLDILLDAGTLALFYSKGRGNAEADLYYTPVKFLRRAKNGPKGLVIPTQEKNLRVKLDEKRLKDLELCRVEKD